MCTIIAKRFGYIRGLSFWGRRMVEKQNQIGSHFPSHTITISHTPGEALELGIWGVQTIKSPTVIMHFVPLCGTVTSNMPKPRAVTNIWGTLNS